MLFNVYIIKYAVRYLILQVYSITAINFLSILLDIL